METIKAIHPDIGNYFLENIILSGGNTLFKGFKERLYKNNS
jgi:actin-related protein